MCPLPVAATLRIMAEDAYTTALLAADHVEQCYTLARFDAPGLTLDNWQRSCLACIEARGGDDKGRCDIIVAIDATGTVRAICTYDCDGDGAPRRPLAVSRFTVAHLVDGVSLAGALLGRLQDVARTFGCSSVELTCQVRPEWARALRRQYDIPVEPKAG